MYYRNISPTYFLIYTIDIAGITVSQIHLLFFVLVNLKSFIFVSSVRSSNSHPDLLVIHPLFQITPVLNTGLSLSEPLQLYKGYNAI